MVEMKSKCAIIVRGKTKLRDGSLKATAFGMGLY